MMKTLLRRGETSEVGRRSGVSGERFPEDLGETTPGAAPHPASIKPDKELNEGGMWERGHPKSGLVACA